jgi:hypothetical protein
MKLFLSSLENLFVDVGAVVKLAGCSVVPLAFAGGFDLLARPTSARFYTTQGKVWSAPGVSLSLEDERKRFYSSALVTFWTV